MNALNASRMSEQQHALAEKYLDAIDEVPSELLARKDQADRLAQALTGGHHVCIRGFWRIGKTTLLKGALKNACERSGGAAIFMDLRDGSTEDGLPKTPESVLARLSAKVQDFLTRVGAAELKVDPKNPLLVLGELAAPIYVGLDEAIALIGLGSGPAGQLLDLLLATPKNVKLALVCHRHRDADALFADKVLANPAVVSEFVLPISDEELVNLVNTPALALGVRFTDEALGALAEITGNRPWELFTFCALAAQALEPTFKGELGPEKVEALLTLDTLAESDVGRAVVDTYLRILVTAMTPDERALVELLATGAEGDAVEDAVRSLEESGWVSTADGYTLNGALMQGIAQAVAQGDIAVKVE